MSSEKIEDEIRAHLIKGYNLTYTEAFDASAEIIEIIMNRLVK